MFFSELGATLDEVRDLLVHFASFNHSGTGRGGAGPSRTHAHARTRAHPKLNFRSSFLCPLVLPFTRVFLRPLVTLLPPAPRRCCSAPPLLRSAPRVAAEAVISASAHQTFVQRWNIFAHKMQKAQYLTGLNKYGEGTSGRPAGGGFPCSMLALLSVSCQKM